MYTVLDGDHLPTFLTDTDDLLQKVSGKVSGKFGHYKIAITLKVRYRKLGRLRVRFEPAGSVRLITVSTIEPYSMAVRWWQKGAFIQGI